MALQTGVGVIIVTYNHAGHIRDCLESVEAANPDEVVVVDNGSSDRTTDIVASEFPDVELVEADENLGYGGGNNLGADHCSSPYLVFLNPDTIVEPGCFEALVEAVAAEGRVLAAPTILDYDGPRINTMGCIAHFTGLYFTRLLGERPDAMGEPGELRGVSGACFATDAGTFNMLGGFDETIFIYMDDAELSWRANARGVAIEAAPKAVVRHDYPDVAVDPEKLYHLERGRYIVLRKYLGRRAAVLAAPSLLLTELLAVGYAARTGLGGLRAKGRAVRDGLAADVDRCDVDGLGLLAQLDARIPADQLAPTAIDRLCLRAANVVYRTNKALIRFAARMSRQVR